ncbi:branched-chain amino acid ABC transporter substrate-binding protein [Pseudonocardia asaccharolytica DSM 44247 = NBRC 16224]|uniref:Branched-chain amino acid ABC transporter substrate-binding protein n=2 Tax=Pseudonocardia asaccharolytica TaxID=54010 RepID=A0A511DCC2_9PSEU|nr:branched-chain amino acid ABC transporter substrate-binding protein [Pseudonocardia asaccharolytica DSM 44247 = NBRC 16224]
MRLLVGLSVLALVAAGCGGGGGEPGGGAAPPTDGGGARADGTLKLGYVLPQTGQLAFLGPPQIQAASYAVSQINDAGGVLGKPIPELVGGDEGDQAAVAQQSADRVLASGVDAVIGAAASGMSLAIIDRVTGAQVVQCSGSNTAPNFTDYNDAGYYFRTAPSDALQGPVLAETIISDGHSRVAIVARADDYGVGLAGATAQALKEAGATVVLNETYDPNAQNFDALVQQVRGAQPDAVVVIAFEEGTQILQGLIEAGMGPGTVGIYGADGLRSEELPELVAPGNPGVLAGMKGTAPASGANEQFIADLKKFAPDLVEVQFAPQVFDCVNIIALAAAAANSDDPTVFKDRIVEVTKDGTKCTSFAECQKLLADGQNIDYDGASGPLDFIPAGEPGTASIEIYSFDEQGRLQSLRTVQSTPVQ